ncbi:DoxX family protein [Candidatus Protofrankia californiensis]|uniref:DoxX family protein n=2 Tax=Protofrankia TaxID=2994361 RepID=A0A1C3NWQ9_9ACTN|nr:DoxX family protein [Candidatus Protofrankia californiensis]
MTNRQTAVGQDTVKAARSRRTESAGPEGPADGHPAGRSVTRTTGRTAVSTAGRMITGVGPAGPRMRRVLSTVVRLGLAVLWLAAGLFKIDDPQGMVRSVRAFRILSEPLVHPVAYAVPFVEIALGLLLLAGLAVRVSAAVSALLLAAYITAIASAAARGLRIDCGCFSSGGDLTAGAPTHYTGEIVRDGLLLVASALLVRLPAGALTVDRLLERGPHPQAAEGPEAAQS